MIHRNLQRLANTHVWLELAMDFILPTAFTARPPCSVPWSPPISVKCIPDLIPDTLLTVHFT